MHTGLRFCTRGAALIGSLLTLATARARAQSTTPAPPTTPPTIDACYVPTSGTIYRIDTPTAPAPGAPKACLSTTHVKFTWNQQGVPGEKGDKGEKGDPGLSSSTAGGDLTGTYPNPTVAGLRGKPVSDSAPASGQVLTYNGTQWIPRAPTASPSVGPSLYLSDTLGVGGHVTLKNGAAVTGPVAIDGAGATPVLRARTGDQSLFSLNATGGLVVGGSYDDGSNSGGIPAEGPGTRMMWYPQKGAFRAGYVNGTQWDDANVGYFSVALGQNVRASGDHSTALGVRVTAAGASAFAVGEDNTASGAASVALGYHAHTNARQGSFVFSDRSVVDTLRAGTNHSANWRVSGGFRIFTSSNLSTGVTIQSGGSTSNWGQSNAVISTSTGAYLSTGGVWTNTSDSTKKTGFRLVDGEQILTRLRGVHLYTWQYKVDDSTTRHMGPTAQAFRKAFGLGDTDKAIGTVDADGVALAGVQALDARTAVADARIAALEARVRMLTDRLARVVADRPNTPRSATSR